jgi:GNAT superfamily N-acetyltransferase
MPMNYWVERVQNLTSQNLTPTPRLRGSPFLLREGGWGVRFRSQLEAIYLASFPLEEQAPFDRLLDGAARGLSDLYIARSEDTVLGFAFVAALSDANIGFLTYLAVDEAHRGGGVGGALFDFALAQTAARGQAGLIWEINDDAEPGISEAEHAKRLRRIAFYQRHGGTLVSSVRRYLIPSAIEGDAPLPARLMWASSDGHPLPPGRITAYVTSMFRTGYGDRHEALLQTILSSIEDTESA